eukprot:2536332-Rhodomonas_salina.1
MCMLVGVSVSVLPACLSLCVFVSSEPLSVVVAVAVSVAEPVSEPVSVLLPVAASVSILSMAVAESVAVVAFFNVPSTATLVAAVDKRKRAIFQRHRVLYLAAPKSRAFPTA